MKKRLIKKPISFILVIALIVCLAPNAFALDFSNRVDKANMLVAEEGFGTAAVDNKIYTFGGSSSVNQNVINTVQMYDPSTDTWSYKTDMPTARRYMCAAEVNGIIYVIGGCTSTTGAFTSANEAYDPATDTWTAKSSMPVAMQGMEAAAVDGKIYVIGGRTSSVTNTLYMYDPGTDTWTRKADMTTDRQHLRAVALNGIIYAIGGLNVSHNDVGITEKYNPQTDTWTTVASLNTVRRGSGVICYNDKIYVLGGFFSTIATGISSIEEYNPDANTWSIVGSLNIARGGMGACVIANSVFVYGGADGLLNSEGVIYNTTEQYIFEPEAPTLSASTSDSQVTLNWDSVNYAASYKVYRSETSDGTYTEIASGITSTSYTDTGLTNGTTYYYKVVAVDSFSNISDYSNIASATPQATATTTGKALLVITMTNGLEKEYDLTMTEINEFIDWYDSKASGNGQGYYTFNKTFKLGPFVNRVDYITFDKIQNFEVMQYE